jgi:hypothetical protein
MVPGENTADHGRRKVTKVTSLTSHHSAFWVIVYQRQLVNKCLLKQFTWGNASSHTSKQLVFLTGAKALCSNQSHTTIL